MPESTRLEPKPRSAEQVPMPESVRLEPKPESAGQVPMPVVSGR